MPRRILPALIAVAAVLAVELRVSFFRVSTNVLPANSDEALNILMARDIASGSAPLLFWTQPYQFPLEAYLISLFVNLLPSDAFGARILPAIAACTSIIGFFFLFRRIGPLRDTWPGFLLLLIPSAYLLVRQSAYMIPQYTLTITFGWMLPLLFLAAATEPRRAVLGVALGFAAGMALSIHLLSLSLVAMVGVAYCLGTSPRAALRNTLAFFPGFAAGMIPYVAAMLLPNGYQKVTETVPPAEALARLWDPLLFRMLPGTLGFNPPLFPDVDYRDSAFADFTELMIGFFVGVVVLATILRIIRLGSLLRARTWPTLEIHDVAVGALWLTLIFACFAGFGVRYRYILPVAWLFPIVLCSLFTAYRSRIFRGGIGAAACALAFVNYFNAKDLSGEWKRPSFAQEEPALPKLDSLVAYLDENDVTHCYASWWLAYRLPFETDGRIVCSQPMNERFPGWPLPLRRVVDAELDTPFVLSSRDRGPYNPHEFQKTLRAREIGFDRETVGHFEVFSNFRHSTEPKSIPLKTGGMSVEVCSNPGDAANILDGDVHTTWASSETSDAPSLHVSLEVPTMIHMIRLYLHESEDPLQQKKMKVSIFDGTDWHGAYRSSEGLMHRLKLGTDERFLGHPYVERTYGFPPILAHAVRIEHPPGEPEQNWTIGELEVFGGAG